MPNAVQFGAIHYIAGPVNQVAAKRNAITDVSKGKRERYLSFIEMPGLFTSQKVPKTSSALVLTGSDVPQDDVLYGNATALRQAVRQYVGTHKKTDANGEPVQYHQLLSWKQNPLVRLWYANPLLTRWVGLKKDDTLLISRSTK